ncbi:MAG: porin family protein [Acidobacteria bacterium]|nr:porin family protein [Acidobacteriota bacterium]
MRRTSVLATAATILLGLCGTFAHAQALPTAVRAGDLQVGAGLVGARSDYSTINWYGMGIYATFDFRAHWGIEADFHQVNAPSPDIMYERTYEIGPRYIWRIHRFTPYAKAMIGRGVFNFQYADPIKSTPNHPVYIQAANLAYNLYTFGGGVDMRVLKHVNARVDYEYQNWMNFPPNGGLSPQLVTIGAAYHF